MRSTMKTRVTYIAAGITTAAAALAVAATGFATDVLAVGVWFG